MSLKTDKTPPKTINMLLDVSNYFGEPNKRMKPVIICMSLISFPAFIYFYLLSPFIPFNIFLPVFIVYVIRVLMKTIGEEGKRVAQFKRILYDAYATPYDLMEVRNIDADGTIEYNNGLISILLVAENGSDCNAIVRANLIKSVIDYMARDFLFDIHIQNVNETEALFDRYDAVARIKDEDAANGFVDSIDYALKKAREESAIQRTIFCMRGRKSDKKEMEENILGILRSESLKTYKHFFRADKDVAEEIIARDLDTYVNFTELQTMRYVTGNYRGSEVVDYDVEERIESRKTLSVKKVENVNVSGFMVKEDAEVTLTSNLDVQELEATSEEEYYGTKYRKTSNTTTSTKRKPTSGPAFIPREPKKVESVPEIKSKSPEKKQPTKSKQSTVKKKTFGFGGKSTKESNKKLRGEEFDEE